MERVLTSTCLRSRPQIEESVGVRSLGSVGSFAAKQASSDDEEMPSMQTILVLRTSHVVKQHPLQLDQCLPSNQLSPLNSSR